MENKYCYEYPRPAVVADCVIFRNNKKATELLLIKRNSNPFKGMWALPGGFVDESETIKTAASRELQEETNLKNIDLTVLNIFSEPNRDPRGRIISIAYWGIASNNQEIKGSDDAQEAKWWVLSELPNLAFDHEKIIEEAKSRIVSINR